MMHDLTDEPWAVIQLASSKRQVEKQPTNLFACQYPWLTTRRRPQNPQWHPLGAPYRLCLGGYAPLLWQSHPLLATAAEVARRRGLGRDLAGVVGEPGKGQLGLATGLSGRNVCGGKKGGEAVGLAKRGQGSKLMVLVDGQGLPLGAMGASAQEAEVHLAEATVETVRI
jgi:hypothetical protein